MARAPGDPGAGGDAGAEPVADGEGDADRADGDGLTAIEGASVGSAVGAAVGGGADVAGGWLAPGPSAT